MILTNLTALHGITATGTPICRVNFFPHFFSIAIRQTFPDQRFGQVGNVMGCSLALRSLHFTGGANDGQDR